MLDSHYFQLPSRSGKGRGQALVEFALTLLVFLMLLVMIIEVGRILWAYVTLQHAAKTGARYAVTGRWIEDYAENTEVYHPELGDDPVNYIYPCHPLFWDDVAAPKETFAERGAWEFYQPFRNPRSCSVERVTLDQMLLLPLDVHADSDEPGFYEIVVSGYTTDKYPTTGTFTRPCSVGDPGCSADGFEELPYSDYFTAAAHVGDNPGLSRGFAGTPQQKVVVQVRYRLPIITPILSSIAESVRLDGTATMVNEAWGSTGNNREAILPPPFVDDLEDLGDMRPPDLVVDSVAINPDDLEDNPAPPPLKMIDIGTPADFTVQITNNGSYDVDDTETFDVTLYAYPNNSLSGTPFPSGDPNLAELATITVSSPGGGASTLARGASRTVTFTDVDLEPAGGGERYFYAWVDSNNDVDEVGTGEDTYPDQEKNNDGVTAESVYIEGNFNLAITTDFYAPGTSNPVDYPAPNSEVDYVVTVRNDGVADSPLIQFEQFLPDELTYLSEDGGNTYDEVANIWEPGVVIPATGVPVEVRLRVRVPSSTASITAWSGVISPAGGGSGLPYDVIHDDTIWVGGVDIGVSVSVEFLSPDQIQVDITAEENTGLNDATGVVINHTMSEPGAVSSWSVTGDGSYDTGTHTWTVDVPAGATRSVTLVGDLDYGGFLFESDVALNTGAMTQHDGNSANDTATASDDVDGIAPTVTLERVTEFALPGSAFTFRAIVENDGPTDATDVEVVITYPSGVTPTGTETWSVGAVGAGSSKTKNFTVTLDAVPPDPLVFEAEITAYNELLTDGWVDTGNLTDTLTVPLSEPTVDLTVNKTVTVEGGGEPYNGEALIYNIRVTNNDTITAEGVTLVDNLPTDYLTNITVQSNTGVSYDGTTWTVGDLAPGDAATLTLRAVIDALGGTIITNTITDTDMDATNATVQIAPGSVSSASITVVASVDLSLLLTADGDATPDDTYTVGADTVEFVMAVSNTGIEDATGVSATLVDPLGGLPSGLSFQSTGTPSHGSYNSGTGLWDIGTLPAGETATWSFVANVDSVPGGGAEGDISVRAQVYAANEDDTDSTPGNYSGGSPSEDDEDIITIHVGVPSVPMPLWVNLGNPSSCPAINWGGSTASALSNLRHALAGTTVTWRQNQAYDATDGWGYVGGSHNYDNNDRVDYPDGGPADSTTQQLFRCRSEGEFSLRLDGLDAGQYRVYIAASDYAWSATWSWWFFTGPNRTFDVTYSVDGGGGITPQTEAGGYPSNASAGYSFNEYNIAQRAGGRYDLVVDTFTFTLGSDAGRVDFSFDAGDDPSNNSSTPLIQGFGIEKIN
jgi:uncharacterized repeat protein (TIGR01451 family)